MLICYTGQMVKNEEDFDLQHKHLLRVSCEDEKWIITHAKSGQTFIFDPALIDFYPDMAHLGLGTDGLFLFWASEVSGDKSGFYSARLRNRMFDMLHLASFFICQDGTTHMFTRWACAIDDSVPDVRETSPGMYNGERPRSGTVFARFIPEAAEYVQRHHAKIKLLGHINTNDSLAMLEAQLDMLTTAFLARIPEEERTETEKALAAAVAESSTLSLHSLEKLRSTISNQKSHIRKEQRLYFDSRGSSVNNDPAS